jgi:hypothetical protein
LKMNGHIIEIFINERFDSQPYISRAFCCRKLQSFA